MCQNPDARIQKTNRYRDEYRRNGLGTKCYWWTGLQPKFETTSIHPIQASYEMLGMQTNMYRQTTVTVYTDGSGGNFPSDPRLRRCGWAWVCPEPGSNKIAMHGARGSLGGKQTAPRAELQAILECFKDLKQCPNLAKIIFYSDCKMAVGSFDKGKVYAQRTACGAIWGDIWEIVEDLEGKGIPLSTCKVQAHTDDHQVSPCTSQMRQPTRRPPCRPRSGRITCQRSGLDKVEGLQTKGHP